MKTLRITLALIVVAVSAAEASDPYDYKELTLTRSNPVQVRPDLFDFGKDGFGWLEFADVKAGGYEVILGEMTNSTGQVTNAYPKSTIRCQRVSGKISGKVHRVPLPPDRFNLKGYDPKAPAIRLPAKFGIVMPFRFVQVVKAPQKLTPSNLRRQMVHYPIAMDKSRFKCDNPVLNEVYEMCKYSVLATSFCGVYVDGDRERTPYEADAYINQLCHYAVEDDYSLARKSHEWLMDHPTWPTEWKQHSIMMAWADWMWSGDTRSLKKFFTRLDSEKLLSQYARTSDGLLVTGGERKKGCVLPNGGDIVDWPRGERDGFEFKPVNAVINAFYYRNLLEMADIAKALDKAAAYGERARRVYSSFNRVFFDSDTGLYVDGEGSRHSSLHANAAALAFGLVPKKNVPGVVAFLEKKGLACSVYFAQYLLDALCKAGRADIAVKLMASSGERSWKGMIDFGSTISLEAWNMKAKPNQDLNHCWGAVPINVISRHILGVTPLEPGFTKISIKPSPGGLKHVEALVPTAQGGVEMEFTGRRLVLKTPAPARVEWQGVTTEVPAGKHVFPR